MSDQPKTALSDDELARRRVAAQEIEWLRDVEAAARHLDHLLSDGAPGLPRPTELLRQLDARLHSLSGSLGQHQTARQRPRQTTSDRWSAERLRAYVCIDETGLSKGNDPVAPYFATAAVIIRAEEMPLIDAAVNGWQRKHFGRERYIHELDVRKGTGAFHFDGDRSRRDAALRELADMLRDLPFYVTCVVIDKDRFRAAHPTSIVDGVLPTRLYPLAVHMMLERVVHCLWNLGDRKGDLEAEGVGEVEDAHLQRAVANLKLTGTRFQSERWFRYQLADHVTFHGKVHNRAGLQLADWVVKPCADAARAARTPALRTPENTVGHAMWEVVREHLWDGEQARKDTFGLKVYPGLSPEERLWLFPEADIWSLADWEPKKAQGPRENASRDP
ncbi:MAG: hypothetical protein IT302_10485 [Dehalococcoidia bacterium]|nr:hypothetical protein [Dehalococcoidia bacterium]